ncbi:ribonuclease H-like protein [Cryphonectria parasitica EP155]|uniref:ribonuclease H n=1 Tax=Cryphonectria parasitica (strain ATCC 38755 / EP155) TaxID=660469 RepID=A0A9P5CTX0_CRYP1|nr:ribonuclease H-like protein [Cryphonectria parasitica EP155]KAF3770132.1 ribonuclease H-like protein [Cryphonectria parasitica EP155]
MASGWMWLSPDSDSDEDGVVKYSPVHLPGGLVVCYRHLRVICSHCCVDYSLTRHEDDKEEEEEEEEEDDDDDNDDDKDEGRVIPKRFKGGDLDHFSSRLEMSNANIRYRDSRDPQRMLIYTDGACLNNGQADPRGGWAFDCSSVVVQGRLERRGPWAGRKEEAVTAQTSNRAELRAVVAALRYCDWAQGGRFTSLVIATDSEYVVQGATSWVKGWLRNGWQTRGGGDVKNRDLWECLLGEVEKASDRGLKVEFWRIPRDENTVADEAAKKAAEGPAPEYFRNVVVS